MKNTPNYIKSLLTPTTKAPAGRKAWSIDLENVWVPFFTATNTMGDSAVPSDALGAPLRLARNKDGSVRFGSNGRPITRIVKPLSESITLVRENFVANLQNYASNVANDKAKEYSEQVALAQKAAKPIKENEQADIDKAVLLQIETAMHEGETGTGTGTENEPEREKVTA